MSPKYRIVIASMKRIMAIVAVSVCSASLLAQTGTPAAPAAKTALVTFVDDGFSALGGTPGQRSQSFRGKLFIENQLLATIEPAHFITFALDPVTVEFTAQTWMATGPAGGTHITLNLEAGKHYFIELRTRQSWPISKMFGVKEITCQQAQKEHAHDVPLEASHVKVTDPPVGVESSFPACL